MEKNLFNSAVRQYQDMVYRVALHIFGSPQDAEDAVQEVFLRLYTRRSRSSTGRSRGSCTGRSWPFRRSTARCCICSTTRS